MGACASTTQEPTGRIDGCVRRDVTVVDLPPDLTVLDVTYDPEAGSYFVIARSGPGTVLYRVSSGVLERLREVGGFRPHFVGRERVLVAEDADLRDLDGTVVFSVDVSTVESHGVRFCWSPERRLAVAPGAEHYTVFAPDAPPRELGDRVVTVNCELGLAALGREDGGATIVELTDGTARNSFPPVGAILRGSFHIGSPTRLTFVRFHHSMHSHEVEHLVDGSTPVSVDLGPSVYFMSSQALLPEGRGAVTVSYGTPAFSHATALFTFGDDDDLVLVDHWEIESTGAPSGPLLAKVFGTADGYGLMRHLDRQLELSRWSCSGSP
ncbi:MAG: hypothetical protein CMN30_28170 [Sandaracinus sp.]|nr:hypothetical protein [Sandaracinus sp.]